MKTIIEKLEIMNDKDLWRTQSEEKDKKIRKIRENILDREYNKETEEYKKKKEEYNKEREREKNERKEEAPRQYETTSATSWLLPPVAKK